MITVTSKIQKTVRWDMGRFRHIVTYSADDTNPKAVVIDSLEDKILELMSSDVVKAPKERLFTKNCSNRCGGYFYLFPVLKHRRRFKKVL